VLLEIGSFVTICIICYALIISASISRIGFCMNFMHFYKQLFFIACCMHIVTIVAMDEERQPLLHQAQRGYGATLIAVDSLVQSPRRSFPAGLNGSPVAASHGGTSPENRFILKGGSWIFNSNSSQKSSSSVQGNIPSTTVVPQQLEQPQFPGEAVGVIGLACVCCCFIL
jgi:hypothetical protein